MPTPTIAPDDFVMLNGNLIPTAEFAAANGIRVNTFGSLDLRGYTQPLPAGLTSVGSLDLQGYTQPLPAGLTSVGSLDLRGYTQPLPAGLTSVGGSLDLRGYTQPLPAWIVSAGADSRGYWFAAVLQDGEWRFRAGCRDYDLQEAREHWGSGGPSDRPDCLALVENLVAQIEARTQEKVA